MYLDFSKAFNTVDHEILLTLCFCTGGRGKSRGKSQGNSSLIKSHEKVREFLNGSGNFPIDCKVREKSVNFMSPRAIKFIKKNWIKWYPYFELKVVESS